MISRHFHILMLLLLSINSCFAISEKIDLISNLPEVKKIHFNDFNFIFSLILIF